MQLWQNNLCCYAALVDYSTKQVFLEGHISKQHEAKMGSLAGEAFQCWKQEGHPGWILDDRDSSILDEMQHREVGFAARPIHHKQWLLYVHLSTSLAYIYRQILMRLLPQRLNNC